MLALADGCGGTGNGGTIECCLVESKLERETTGKPAYCRGQGVQRTLRMCRTGVPLDSTQYVHDIRMAETHSSHQAMTSELAVPEKRRIASGLWTLSVVDCVTG